MAAARSELRMHNISQDGLIQQEFLQRGQIMLYSYLQVNKPQAKIMPLSKVRKTVYSEEKPIMIEGQRITLHFSISKPRQCVTQFPGKKTLQT